MKKKGISMIVAAMMLAAALCGCGAAPAESVKEEASAAEETAETEEESAETGMANPWTEAASMEEAAEGAGLEFFDLVPDLDLGIGPEFARTIRYMDGIAEVQLEYPAAMVIVRKGTAAEDGDISGDYNEYAHTWTQNIKGLEVTCFGNREGDASKIIWTQGDISYSITAVGLGGDDDFGISADAVNSVINGLQ